MPEKMRKIDTQMHHETSQLAIVLKDGAVNNDLLHPLAELSQVTSQCIACHNSCLIH